MLGSVKMYSCLKYLHSSDCINKWHPSRVCPHRQQPSPTRHQTRQISNEKIFNNAKVPYEEAIKRAGHTEKLSYQPPVQQGQSRRRRRRKILWFNPPFDASMTTKLGKVFLNILDKCFLVGHVLRRVLDRHMVRLSYQMAASWPPSSPPTTGGC